MGEDNTPTALKVCRVKSVLYFHRLLTYVVTFVFHFGCLRKCKTGKPFENCTLEKCFNAFLIGHAIQYACTLM